MRERGWQSIRQLVLAALLLLLDRLELGRRRVAAVVDAVVEAVREGGLSAALAGLADVLVGQRSGEVVQQLSGGGEEGGGGERVGGGRGRRH